MGEVKLFFFFFLLFSARKFYRGHERSKLPYYSPIIATFYYSTILAWRERKIPNLPN